MILICSIVFLIPINHFEESVEAEVMMPKGEKKSSLVALLRVHGRKKEKMAQIKFSLLVLNVYYGLHKYKITNTISITASQTIVYEPKLLTKCSHELERIRNCSPILWVSKTFPARLPCVHAHITPSALSMLRPVVSMEPLPSLPTVGSPLLFSAEQHVPFPWA